MRKFVTGDRTVSLQNPVGDHAQNKKQRTTLARGRFGSHSHVGPVDKYAPQQTKEFDRKAEIENPGSVGHWHRSCARNKELWS